MFSIVSFTGSGAFHFIDSRSIDRHDIQRIRSTIFKSYIPVFSSNVKNKQQTVLHVFVDIYTENVLLRNLSLINQYIFITITIRMKKSYVKVLVEMEWRTCTMVRHESMTRNDKKDSSSCIIPKDRPVHGRSIQPLQDRFPVYRSNAAVAFAACEARNGNVRGT